MIRNKKILVTGVCGFLGHNLAKRLLENDNEIFGIDKMGNSERIKDLLSKINFLEGDLSKKHVFEKVPNDIDYILHFGSPASIILFNKDPFGCFSTTVNSMFNVLEFAKKIEVVKLVYPSTASVYAGNENPHSENILPKPRNTYGAAKLACEGLASAYYHYVNSTGLRIFAVYGPGEENKLDCASVVYLFLNEIKNKRKPIIYGDGTQTRDFIYIDDAIDGIINSLESNYNGVINVGSGKSTSFNQIIEIISSILEKKIDPKYIEKKINYVENLKADISLMQMILKIRPREIQQGIKEFSSYLGLFD